MCRIEITMFQAFIMAGTIFLGMFALPAIHVLIMFLIRKYSKDDWIPTIYGSQKIKR